MKRPLTENGEFTVNEIDNMSFEIIDGGVRVIYSDCPDKICVHSGLITNSYMSAVCLPKKVVVSVEGADDE